MPYKSKQDQAVAAQRHYAANKKKMKARAVLSKRKGRERNKKALIAYLEEHPCVDCGEHDIIVLEFDHVRGTKTRSVSRMAYEPVGLPRLMEEIEKCEVRCANCHRRRTAKGIVGFRSMKRVAGSNPASAIDSVGQEDLLGMPLECRLFRGRHPTGSKLAANPKRDHTLIRCWA